MRGLFWLGFTAVVALQVFHFAAISLNKPFSEDESFQLTTNCNPPMGIILKDGIDGQCSRAPLYYIFQKYLLVPIRAIDDTVLFKYRIPNIALAGGFALGTALMLANAYTPAAILLGVYAITKQPLFAQYAAENRPYILWIALFAWCTILAGLFAQKWKNLGRFPLSLGIMFGLSGLALAMTASPGFIQFYAAAFVVFWIRRKPQDWIKMLPLLIPVAAIGIYYTLQAGCESHGNQYNLWKTLDYHLVLGVARLLFPKGNWVDWALNGLMLVGAWRMLHIIPKLKSLSKRHTLEATLLFQFLATFCIMALVIVSQYYFIQRVFLHLMICYGFLVLLGAQWIFQKYARRHLTSTALILLFSILVFEMIPTALTDQKTIADFRDAKPTVDCTQWNGPYQIIVPSNVLNAHKMKAVLALGHEIRACGKPLFHETPSPSAPHILVTGKPGQSPWFEILAKSNAGLHNQVMVCGHQYFF